MKGLSAPTIIGIIIAIVAGVFILYALWVYGYLPFGFGVSQTQCMTDLASACEGTKKFTEINKACFNWIPDEFPSKNCRFCINGKYPDSPEADLNCNALTINGKSSDTIGDEIVYAEQVRDDCCSWVRKQVTPS
ncbi:MAG: hypothetical protein ACTSX6_06455 [Candidatus Heimdallarchaeaceae archaeon]